MKKLFVELLNQRCIAYALRILGGRTPRTPPSKSASGYVYVCWGIYVASVSTMFLLDFGTVPKVIYFCSI